MTASIERRRKSHLPSWCGKVIWRVAASWCAMATFGAMSSEGPARQPSTPEQIEFFEQHIRPILVHHCYECHGAKKSKGGLRVDYRDGLLAGGDSGPALLPGQAGESLLIQSIAHRHDDYKMPKDRPKLPESVIGNFITWVQQGAADPRDQPAATDADSNQDWDAVFEVRKQWWSLQPLRQSAIPDVPDRTWSQHAVDRFVWAKLREQGIRPGGPASPGTWLRRVHFAVIGLPPTPAETGEFLADSSPAARARVVDRLLESPHFGERWARHWMDLVRFSESYGHEQDYDIPHAWQYRDYLIRAFNADVPYNQLVREHIAGDLLDDPRVNPVTGWNESVIAPGFWYLHQATHAPVDPLQDEADRIDNQIDVFSKAFLGLTVACARCHDHKFDAISTRDYYSLAAFLRSSRQNIALLDPDRTLSRRFAELRRLHTGGTARLVTAMQHVQQAGGPSIAQYLAATDESLPQAANPLHTEPTGVAPDGGEPHVRAVAAVAAERGLDAERLQRWVQALRSPEAQQPTHPLRGWLEQRSREAASPGSEHRDSASSQSPPQPSPADQSRAAAVVDLFPASASDAWVTSGWAFQPATDGRTQWRATAGQIELIPSHVAHSGLLADGLQGVLRSPTFELQHDNIHLRLAGTGGQVRLIIARYALREFNPLLFGETLLDVSTEGRFEWRTMNSDIRRHKGKLAYFEIIDNGSGFVALDRIVFSDSPQPPQDAGPREAISGGSRAELAVALEAQARNELQDWLTNQNPGKFPGTLAWLLRQGLLFGPDAGRDVANLIGDIDKSACGLPSPVNVLSMTDGSVEKTQVFLRGDHRTPGPTVARRFLQVAAGPDPMPIAQGSGRRELAAAITAKDNPLLYRAIVNRVWGRLFGRGLAPSVDNLGALGQPPTHPELLDYLALSFRDEGTSFKQLIRSLCLTETFAMSSNTDDPEAESRDPDNALLHRQRVRRLEAEIVRDNLLAVAGTLDRTQFGPSVPTYLSPFMGDPFWLTVRGIKSGPMDGNHRRTIYLESRRNFLSPLLLAFDLAVPDTTVGQRNTSNVPGQALALMNDPLVRQLAEAWARAELDSGEPDARGISSKARIERLFVRALARPPRADELEVMLTLLATQAEANGVVQDEAAPDPRLWADLCHVLFMMKEFIYVP